MAFKNKPKHNKIVSSHELNKLSPALAFEGGYDKGKKTIRKEDLSSIAFGEDACLLLNGELFHDESILFIRREGKLIEIWSTGGAKFMFTLEKKSTPEWERAFEEGLIHKVVMAKTSTILKP